MSPGAPGRTSARNLRIVTATGISSTIAVLPISVLGALAPLMRVEGDLTDARLGAAVATFFAASAVTSVLGGRLAERFGGGHVMAAATFVGAASLFALAFTAHRTAGLFLVMSVAGGANAVAQTAGNVALAAHVDEHVKGLSFGVKLAAIPLAGLLAGVSVPALGVPLGWQPAMAAGAVLALPFWLVLPGGLGTGRAASPAARQGPRIALPWVLMGVTAALGSAAGNAMQVFYVSSAVSTGIDASVAGFLLACGSGVGIVGRIVWGWAGARPGVPARPLLAALFVVGGLSFLGIGLAGSVPLLGVATVLAFATGWSWAGLLLYAVVETSPQQPGSATGVVLTGVWIGGIAGPLLFGNLVEWRSFTVAWATMGLFLALGGVVALLRGHRQPT